MKISFLIHFFKLMATDVKDIMVDCVKSLERDLHSFHFFLERLKDSYDFETYGEELFEHISV